ncbi:MAG: DUF5615 family PIN-like protein [Acidobacteriales bacterium]|nr:DUF5615 family PIN-like protein [Terriglobales bacterium]
MKLLFDENLSVHLPTLLKDVFPGSAHLFHIGFASAPDSDVWEFAKRERFVLVTKDADFYERSAQAGQPPKVLWLQLGNCRTQLVVEILCARRDEIQGFWNDPETAFLILGKKRP